jgi:plasmid stabilization system protein ParE
MVAGSPGLTVTLTPEALAALDRIWEWNARTYSDEHADRYIAFVRKETAKLSRLHFAGKPVSTRPSLSYITIRKRRGGHGHVAVYQVIGDVVLILNYYHTAQDWPSKLIP